MEALPAVLVSPPLAVGADAVARYAELTDDFNPIHLDADFAAATPFGTTIAHGTLSLALLLETFAVALPMGWHVATLDIRWTAPLPVGSRIVAEAVRDEGDGNGNGGRYEAHVTSEEGVRTLSGRVTVGRVR